MKNPHWRAGDVGQLRPPQNVSLYVVLLNDEKYYYGQENEYMILPKWKHIQLRMDTKLYRVRHDNEK